MPGDAMRTTGAIRVRDGRISAIGDLTAEPSERLVDAAGCVVYPGLMSTHHHLFQSVLKARRHQSAADGLAGTSPRKPGP
jgi:cytosine/adenosine deaminase-related metal-dependent hydrolase